MSLKVLILCAGYGTRLEHDLKLSDKYSHLVGVPKPLLPIGDRPLLSHWIDQILDLNGAVDEIIIITNDTNDALFKEWRNGLTARKNLPLTLISDGTNSNESRLGAVSCIKHIVDACDLEASGHDLVVIAGDTLFHEDVKLNNIIETFHQFKSKEARASLVIGCPCAETDVHKHGILEVDDADKVVQFLEKPSPGETSSRIQCPCFYIIQNGALHLLNDFLEEKKDESLQARDAPGNFIRYLIERSPVYCKQVSGRFDVGGLASYLDCCSYFQGRLSSR